jgi:hypothetical protein
MLITCGSAREDTRGGRTFPSDRSTGIEWARVAARVGKARPVLSVVNDDGTAADGSSLIDEIVREGARRMLSAALEAEVDAAQGGVTPVAADSMRKRAA